MQRKPLNTNAADESQVKEATAKEVRAHERELNDVRAILGTKEGRRLYWRYLGFCKVFSSTFNHSGSVTAYQEGMRNVGLALLADVHEADPSAYLLMLKESEGDKNV
jgi:hypothetical protein